MCINAPSHLCANIQYSNLKLGGLCARSEPLLLGLLLPLHGIVDSIMRGHIHTTSWVRDKALFYVRLNRYVMIFHYDV